MTEYSVKNIIWLNEQNVNNRKKAQILYRRKRIEMPIEYNVIVKYIYNSAMVLFQIDVGNICRLVVFHMLETPYTPFIIAKSVLWCQRSSVKKQYNLECSYYTIPTLLQQPI